MFFVTAHFDKNFLALALTEQVPLFEGLVNSERHLVITEKLPHSNVTLSKEQQSKQEDTFKIAKNYQNILSVVFFRNYIANNKKYQDYLSPEYLDAIEQQPYELHLVTKNYIS